MYGHGTAYRVTVSLSGLSGTGPVPAAGGTVRLGVHAQALHSSYKHHPTRSYASDASPSIVNRARLGLSGSAYYSLEPADHAPTRPRILEENTSKRVGVGGAHRIWPPRVGRICGAHASGPSAVLTKLVGKLLGRIQLRGEVLVRHVATHALWEARRSVESAWRSPREESA